MLGTCPEAPWLAGPGDSDYGGTASFLPLPPPGNPTPGVIEIRCGCDPRNAPGNLEAFIVCKGIQVSLLPSPSLPLSTPPPLPRRSLGYCLGLELGPDE